MITTPPPTPANPSSMRQWNEHLVLSALTPTPQRISELVPLTGLTPPALGEVIRSLQSKHWVRSVLPQRPVRGRPPQLFALNRPQGCVVSVDIGPHAIRAVALDLEGSTLGTIEDRLPPMASPTQRLAMVESLTGRLAEMTGNPPLWLSVVTLPGYVSESSKLVDSSVIPEWAGHYPADIFKGIIPGPIIAINDVRAATWAEKEVGGAQGCSDVLFLKLGRRPSLGTLIGGTPHLGAHGRAGDLSRISLLPPEEHMDWLKPFAADDPVGDAIRQALTGDAIAIESIARYMSSIAPALSLAIATVDPTVFVVGGAPAPLAPHFLPQLRDRIAEEVVEPPTIIASTLDQFASALGGALSGIEKIRQTLLSPTTGVGEFSRDNLFEMLRLGRAAETAN